MIIKAANISDLQILCDLGSKTFYDTYVAYNTAEDMQAHLQENFSESATKTQFLDPNIQFLLIWDLEKVIGYVKLSRKIQLDELRHEQAVEIARFYIEKAYFGKGIAQNLMQACIEFAREQGYNTIWLGVWKQNPRAIRFYQKCGFEIFSEQIFYLGKDAQLDFLMKKSL